MKPRLKKARLRDLLIIRTKTHVLIYRFDALLAS